MKKTFCLSISLLMLLMMGCKTSRSGGEVPNSSLSGIFDSQHVLRLAPVGYFGVYRFEVCLVEVLNGSLSDSDHCVGALKTNSGEDLLLTLEIIEDMSLSEKDKARLQNTHSDYQAYQRSLANRGRDKTLMSAGSAGLVIGGGSLEYKMYRDWKAARTSYPEVLKTIDDKVAAQHSHQSRSLVDQKRIKALNEMVGDMESAQESKMQISSQMDEELAKLKGIEEKIAQQKQKLNPYDIVRQKLAGASLDDISKESESIASRFRRAGLSLDLSPGSVASHPADLANRKTLLSDKFLDFLMDSIGLEKTSEMKDFLISFGYNDQNLDLNLFKKWKDSGGTIREVIEPGFLEDLFKYNRIENALLPQHPTPVAMKSSKGGGFLSRFLPKGKKAKVVAVAADSLALPQNMAELTKAFEAGDYRFLKSAVNFIQSGGVPPTALALHQKYVGYQSILPQSKLFLTQLEDEAKSTLQKISDLEQQVKTVDADLDRRFASLSQESDTLKVNRGAAADALDRKAIDQLKKQADNLMKTIKMGPKAMAAVAVMVSSAVGGLLYITNASHIQAQEKAQPIIDHYDALQIVMHSSSALLSLDPSVNQLVSGISVKDVVIGLAQWQAHAWVDSHDTGLVVTKICMPKMTSNGDKLLEQCQLINS